MLAPPMASRRDVLRAIATWARGLAAIASLGVLGVVAYLMLVWGPIGRGGIERVIRDPLVLGVLAALPVPIAAFPWVSDRLRGRAVRWVIAPSTLVALAMCVGLTYDALARGFVDEHVPLIVLPTLPCALYLAWCVLATPRKRE